MDKDILKNIYMTLYPFHGRKLKSLMDDFGCVLIKGSAGTGKTMMVTNFLREQVRGYSQTRQYYGFEINGRFDASSLLRDLNRYRRSLFIVDALQEVSDGSTKDQILRVIKEGRKYGIRSMLTSQPHEHLKPFEENAYVIDLQLAADAYRGDYIKALLKNFPELFKDEKAVAELVAKYKYHPGTIAQLVDFMREEKILSDDVLYSLERPIIYEQDLVQPTSEKLITDVRVINKTIYELVKNNPRNIYKLRPREFEILVAELFEKDGYAVTITPETRDGGKDILVVEQKNIGKFLFYVECKKNAENRPVGIGIIQRLYGTVIADKATAGIVVTSSYFSDPAKDFTEKISHQMSLIDFIHLSNWIKQFDKEKNAILV